MQRRILKFLIILLPLFFWASKSLFAQVSTYRLVQADSLFKAKRFTQSLAHYEHIIEQKQYSPAMLLKMAYIEEGLNNIGKALYYLNLYYLASHDKAALDKMDELAERHNLTGYKNTDAQLALSFYQDYHTSISIAVGAFCVFLFCTMLYAKKQARQPYASWTLLILFSALWLTHINMGDDIPTGIVTTPNTYLMKGPSAGASVTAIIEAGHRVEIIGQHDVWVKIVWNGEEAFIKQHNVLPVRL